MASPNRPWHYPAAARLRLPLIALAALLPWSLASGQVKAVTLDSPSNLIQLRVMVMAGSAYDPIGQEGLAAATAQLLIEGSFGDPANPVTKEMLADITRAWGGGASPAVRVEKETSTFRFTIPREVFGTYVKQVLEPLFNRPLFSADELSRLKEEGTLYIKSTLRLENTEQLGLFALDVFIHEGSSYGHLTQGSVQGIANITADDIRRFYKTYYHRKNMTIGISTTDGTLVKQVQRALRRTGAKVRARKLPKLKWAAATAPAGREMLIISQPTTIATGIHAGFPIAVDRNHPDYWPLYVANVALGTHRDSFGRLYREIRVTRGYNYGDYSYMEWFYNRPFNLFPPTNTPRREQYFSLWIRPVAHEYAHHLTKALIWELEEFIRTGLTPEEVALAKNKARILYLSLAETASRLLEYRLDDAFYGMDEGYLDQYLAAIDAVTPEQANAAIKRHLQTENLKFVVITNDTWADRLAEDIGASANATGKDYAAYNFETIEVDGQTEYVIPDAKRAMLEKDDWWEAYDLAIPAGRIRVVRSTQLFESYNLIEPE